jgi:hypothetical protein
MADVDNDGDPDAISGSLSWIENTDGKGTFSSQRAIDPESSAHSVASADVDGDGDLDVLSASLVGSKIPWYENMDGKGSFGAQRVITSAASGVGFVASADVDGDGDLDVLSSAHVYQPMVAWYENSDGKGSFGPQRVISRSSFAVSLATADLDGDGDLDVLSISTGGSIAWYENTDAKGDFDPQRVVTSETPGGWSVATADVDADGDQDILSASVGNNKIAWYENTDGKASFGPQRVITTEASQAHSVRTADGDGDVDVVSGSTGDSKIAWYENTDGKGGFGPQRVITSEALGLTSIVMTDVDGDDDVDVVSASPRDGKIAWYENLSRLVGDSNGDGVFNSSDLIVVFQAGEYEDGIAGNSTFEEGDWNCDAEFDSGDLVLAFQSGNYVSAAKFAAAVHWLLAETNDKTSRAKPRHMSLDVTNDVLDAWWSE